MDTFVEILRNGVDLLPAAIFWAVYLSQDSCLLAAASLVSTERLPWRAWAICVGSAHCVEGYAAMYITHYVFSSYLPYVYGLAIVCSLWFLREHISHMFGNGAEEEKRLFTFQSLGLIGLFLRALIHSIDSLAYGPVVIGHSAANGQLTHSHASPLLHNALSSGDFIRATLLMGGVGIFITALMWVFCWTVNRLSKQLAGPAHQSETAGETKGTRMMHGVAVLLLLNLILGSMCWGLLFGLNVLPLELQSGFQFVSFGCSCVCVGLLLWSVERKTATTC